MDLAKCQAPKSGPPAKCARLKCEAAATKATTRQSWPQRAARGIAAASRPSRRPAAARYDVHPGFMSRLKPRPTKLGWALGKRQLFLAWWDITARRSCHLKLGFIWRRTLERFNEDEQSIGEHREQAY